MKTLILYATTDGQTRKVAHHCADRLTKTGHTVELIPAGDAAGVKPTAFDSAILAGSVHAGGYQSELIRYAKAEARSLAMIPTLFLSVSLSAAGDDKDDWKGLHDCAGRFQEETGWTPGRVEHVAGAFSFTQYDFFRSWAMRWIARGKGLDIDPKVDTEYTDWKALDALIDEWAASQAKVA
jgi:menaquinone-dependent protoporphyrinogen oxidase